MDLDDEDWARMQTSVVHKETPLFDSREFENLWVCTLRPAWDSRAEIDEDEDREFEVREQNNVEAAKVYNREWTEFEGYKWILTPLGRDRMDWWDCEYFKRATGQFRLNMSHKRNYHASMEVTENAVSCVWPQSETCLSG